MPVDINGTTGVTTPALASTAMPTSGGDPVVESGSNTDGEWTRFADGTQIVGKKNFSLGYASSALLTSQWTYPVAFVSPPFNAGLFSDNPGSRLANNSALDIGVLHLVNTASNTSTSFRAGATNTFDPADVMPVDAWANGRWK